MPEINIKDPAVQVDILATVAYLELCEAQDAKRLNEWTEEKPVAFLSDGAPISVTSLHQFTAYIESAIYSQGNRVKKERSPLEGQTNTIEGSLSKYSPEIQAYVRSHFLEARSTQSAFSIPVEEIAGRGLLALRRVRLSGHSAIDNMKISSETDQKLFDQINAAQDRMQLFFEPNLVFARHQVLALESRASFKKYKMSDWPAVDVAFNELVGTDVAGNGTQLNQKKLQNLIEALHLYEARVTKAIEDHYTSGAATTADNISSVIRAVVLPVGLNAQQEKWIQDYALNPMLAPLQSTAPSGVLWKQGKPIEKKDALKLALWPLQVARDLEVIDENLGLGSSLKASDAKIALTAKDAQKEFTNGLNILNSANEFKPQESFSAASSNLGLAGLFVDLSVRAYDRARLNFMFYGRGADGNQQSVGSELAASIYSMSTVFSYPIYALLSLIFGLSGQDPRYWNVKNQLRLNDFCDLLGNLIASPLIVLTQVIYHVANELRQAFLFKDDSGNFSIFNDPVFDRLAKILPKSVADNLKPDPNDAFGKFLMGMGYFLFIKPLQLWFDLPAQIASKVITGTLRTIFPSIQYFSKEARDKFFNGLSSVVYYLAVGVIATFTGAAVVGGAANAAAYVKTVAGGFSQIKVPFVGAIEGLGSIPAPPPLSKLGVILTSIFVPLGTGLGLTGWAVSRKASSKQSQTEEEALKSHKVADLGKGAVELKELQSNRPGVAPQSSNKSPHKAAFPRKSRF